MALFPWFLNKEAHIYIFHQAPPVVCLILPWPSFADGSCPFIFSWTPLLLLDPHFSGCTGPVDLEVLPAPQSQHVLIRSPPPQLCSSLIFPFSLSEISSSLSLNRVGVKLLNEWMTSQKHFQFSPFSISHIQLVTTFCHSAKHPMSSHICMPTYGTCCLEYLFHTCSEPRSYTASSRKPLGPSPGRLSHSFFWDPTACFTSIMLYCSYSFVCLSPLLDCEQIKNRIYLFICMLLCLA